MPNGSALTADDRAASRECSARATPRVPLDIAVGDGYVADETCSAV